MNCSRFRFLIQQKFDMELTPQDERMLLAHMESCESCAKFHYQLQQVILAAEEIHLPEDMLPSKLEVLARNIMQQLPQPKQTPLNLISNFISNLIAQVKKTEDKPATSYDESRPKQKAALSDEVVSSDRKMEEDHLATSSRLRSIGKNFAEPATDSRDAQSQTRSLGETLGMATSSGQLGDQPLTLAESIRRKVSEAQKPPLDQIESEQQSVAEGGSDSLSTEKIPQSGNLLANASTPAQPSVSHLGGQASPPQQTVLGTWGKPGPIENFNWGFTGQTDTNPVTSNRIDNNPWESGLIPPNIPSSGTSQTGATYGAPLASPDSNPTSWSDNLPKGTLPGDPDWGPPPSGGTWDVPTEGLKQSQSDQPSGRTCGESSISHIWGQPPVQVPQTNATPVITTGSQTTEPLAATSNAGPGATKPTDRKKASWSVEAEQIETGTWQAFNPGDSWLSTSSPPPAGWNQLAKTSSEQQFEEVHTASPLAIPDAELWGIEELTGQRAIPIEPASQQSVGGSIPTNSIVNDMQAQADNRWNTPIQERIVQAPSSHQSTSSWNLPVIEKPLKTSESAPAQQAGRKAAESSVQSHWDFPVVQKADTQTAANHSQNMASSQTTASQSSWDLPTVQVSHPQNFPNTQPSGQPMISPPTTTAAHAESFAQQESQGGAIRPRPTPGSTMTPNIIPDASAIPAGSPLSTNLSKPSRPLASSQAGAYRKDERQSASLFQNLDDLAMDKIFTDNLGIKDKTLNQAPVNNLPPETAFTSGGSPQQTPPDKTASSMMNSSMIGQPKAAVVPIPPVAPKISPITPRSKPPTDPTSIPPSLQALKEIPVEQVSPNYSATSPTPQSSVSITPPLSVPSSQVQPTAPKTQGLFNLDDSAMDELFQTNLGVKEPSPSHLPWSTESKAVDQSPNKEPQQVVKQTQAQPPLTLSPPPANPLPERGQLKPHHHQTQAAQVPLSSSQHAQQQPASTQLPQTQSVPPQLSPQPIFPKQNTLEDAVVEGRPIGINPYGTMPSTGDIGPGSGGLFSIDDSVIDRIFADNLGIHDSQMHAVPKININEAVRSLSEAAATIPASDLTSPQAPPPLPPPPVLAPAQREAPPPPPVPTPPQTTSPLSTPPTIEGVGRLDARTGTGSDVGSGRIASIGKFLLDQKDLEKIGKLTGADLSDTKMRILTLEAAHELQTLLNHIGSRSGVIGSVIVGHDGLLIANTMPPDIDGESIGVWALCIYMNTEHVVKKMKHNRIHQVVSRTPRGYVVIADFGGGLLVTVSDGKDTDMLIPLMQSITQLVAQ